MSDNRFELNEHDNYAQSCDACGEGLMRHGIVFDHDLLLIGFCDPCFEALRLRFQEPNRPRKAGE